MLKRTLLVLLAGCSDPTAPPVVEGAVSVLDGDKELTVAWDAVAGASGYVITRTGPTDYEGTKTIATLPGDATSYLDSPVNFADPDGRGLVNGETYLYEVLAVIDGAEVSLAAPVAGTPDDGAVVPGWTEQHGLKKRDARTTGWRPTGVTLTRVEGDYTMTDGEVVDGLLIEGSLIIPPEVKSGTVKRTWIRCDNGPSTSCVFNGGYPVSNTTPILFEDVEIGRSMLEGLPREAFGAGAGISWVTFTARRVYVHGIGTAFFATDPGCVVEDSYINDLFADGPDPHIDVVYVQSTSVGPVRVSRNNMETYVGGSANLGPGAIESGTYLAEDNLFNGGSLTVTANENYTITGNRWKRQPSGFWSNGPYWFPTNDPAVWTDNLWVDDGSPIIP
jgi:hypothetical protein